MSGAQTGSTSGCTGRLKGGLIRDPVDTTDAVQETVSAVYQAESRRVLATLIRLLGDFDLAEEALHDAFRAALEQWPTEGVPANPRAGWSRPAASRRSTACAGSKRFDALDQDGSRRPTIGVDRCGGVGGSGERRGRSAAPHLHLLPSGAGARGAGRADASRGLRPDHRGDRAAPSSRPRPPSRSASSAPRARSATHGFPIRCRRPRSFPSGSTRCCA